MLGGETTAHRAAGLANLRKILAATGQEFVDVHLMAHVPDEFVFRRGKDAVQSNGEFDHAKIWADG